MKIWFTAHNGHEDMRAQSVASRTEQQRAWDHAIITAAEFIRRLDNYDEKRALALHQLLSTKLPKE